ncbi:hypothetical protein Psuf_023180 [Phytohabitans suffuscus]|uniref:Activator of Hsp90 ATPase homologue 1/2-like C-terminal domain-containing protein n=1 Tax=Phytohabitans suffuscus TaxID=624315 RepID=A0A6F8YFV7_9ACTN|nr:SRPBCC domain-containing protein [Phytohabitans suffuscus]BCB85005.1 hypothetical protein Psuf_023180 [Phytohabitans suffuscus]
MTEIRIDFDFGHPPALVWRALTERRQLSRWFIPGDIEPIQGSQFQLLPDALPGFDGPISGQVLEVSAERRLVMRWRGEQLHARVTWELKPTPDGCLLMVSQSGFLGVRGSARRQALVSTYDRLYGERLPAVLDGLAGKADVVVPRPPRVAPPVAPGPDRRRQLLAVAAAALLIGLVAALLANLPAGTSAPAEAEASRTGGRPAAYGSATAASSSTAIEATQRPPSASPSPTPRATTAAPAPTTSSRVERTTSAPPPAALTARYSTVSTAAPWATGPGGRAEHRGRRVRRVDAHHHRAAARRLDRCGGPAAERAGHDLDVQRVTGARGRLDAGGLRRGAQRARAEGAAGL